MVSVRDMSAVEVAQELVYLANNRPTSGGLNQLNRALDAFRKHNADLDELLVRFDKASVQFIRVVQRGYAGTPQWRELKETATEIAPLLSALPDVKAEATK